MKNRKLKVNITLLYLLFIFVTVFVTLVKAYISYSLLFSSLLVMFLSLSKLAMMIYVLSKRIKIANSST